MERHEETGRPPALVIVLIAFVVVAALTVLLAGPDAASAVPQQAVVR